MRNSNGPFVTRSRWRALVEWMFARMPFQIKPCNTEPHPFPAGWCCPASAAELFWNWKRAISTHKSNWRISKQKPYCRLSKQSNPHAIFYHLNKSQEWLFLDSLHKRTKTGSCNIVPLIPHNCYFNVFLCHSLLVVVFFFIGILFKLT